MNYKGTIKVDKSVTPIHFQLRTPFNQVEGEKYYVSFGSNEAIPCRLLSIHERGISIEIQTNPGSRNNRTSTHSLNADEIGRTPEEAVINTVTS